MHQHTQDSLHLKTAMFIQKNVYTLDASHTIVLLNLLLPSGCTYSSWKEFEYQQRVTH